MGDIGRLSQRFEVLPAERYELEDLLRTWQRDAQIDAAQPDGPNPAVATAAVATAAVDAAASSGPRATSAP